MGKQEIRAIRAFLKPNKWGKDLHVVKASKSMRWSPGAESCTDRAVRE